MTSEEIEKLRVDVGEIVDATGVQDIVSADAVKLLTDGIITTIVRVIDDAADARPGGLTDATDVVPITKEVIVIVDQGRFVVQCASCGEYLVNVPATGPSRTVVDMPSCGCSQSHG